MSAIKKTAIIVLTEIKAIAWWMLVVWAAMVFVMAVGSLSFEYVLVTDWSPTFRLTWAAVSLFAWGCAMLSRNE